MVFVLVEVKVKVFNFVVDVVWDVCVEIIKVNVLDMDYGCNKGFSDVMMDCLMLDEGCI